MTDLQFVVLAALLGWIAYQFTMHGRDRRTARIDELARHMCPNLYAASGRIDLREWVKKTISADDIVSREGAKRGGWIPLERDLVFPDTRWGDVHETWISRGHECEFGRKLSSDERKHLLEPATAITMQFMRTVRESTVLTKWEIDYLAYRAWSLALTQDHLGPVTDEGVRFCVECQLDEESVVTRYAKSIISGTPQAQP